MKDLIKCPVCNRVMLDKNYMKLINSMAETIIKINQEYIKSFQMPDEWGKKC